jgi:hypothetical protein
MSHPISNRSPETNRNRCRKASTQTVIRGEQGEQNETRRRKIFLVPCPLRLSPPHAFRQGIDRTKPRLPSSSVHHHRLRSPQNPSRSRVSGRRSANGGLARPLVLGRARVRAACGSPDRDAAGAAYGHGSAPSRGGAPRGDRRRGARRRPARESRG